MENTKTPRTYEHLKKFHFKPGVSGNPSGRPKGKTMKAYAREYLASMSEEDRVEFLNSMDGKVIWEMAEGKPKQDIELEGEVVNHIISIDE